MKTGRSDGATMAQMTDGMAVNGGDGQGKYRAMAQMTVKQSKSSRSRKIETVSIQCTGSALIGKKCHCAIGGAGGVGSLQAAGVAAVFA